MNLTYSNSKVAIFLGFWVVNSIALLVSTLIFKNNIVLGNVNDPKSISAVFAGLILTLVVYAVPIGVEKAGLEKTIGKTPSVWAGIYLGANFVTIWVLKRFAEFTGLGVSNLLYVLILAIIVTLAGWGVAKITGAMS